MSTVPPNAYITPASPVVVEQISRLNERADQTTDLALSGVRSLMALNFNNVNLDPRLEFSEEDLEALLAQLGGLPNFDSSTDWLADLDLSAGNEDFQFNPEIYQYLRQMLPEFSLSPLGALPTEPAPPPEPGEPEDIPAPTRPDMTVYAAPDVDLDIAPPTYEDATSSVPFPTLRPIVLPNPPIINTDDITFEGVRPIFNATAPNADDFNFVNGTYSPILLDESKATILKMLQGGFGLSPGVEDAIFERAREREAELGERDVQIATDDWGSRGWKKPPGMLNAARERARTEASRKISANNREQMIETLKIQVEQVRVALANSLALEDLWVRLFISAEDRRLQASRMKLDLALQVFNAFVTRFQAEAQLFSIDAQVFNQKFQAAMAKLSLYSEQLRAQQMIGELNEQDVRIFAQRIQALQTNAEIYRARVEGFRAQYEAINSKVNVYRAQLESNQTIMSGYETDSRVFSTMMEAQTRRDNRFAVRADIYGKNIEAWSQRVDVLYKQQDREVKQAELTRDVFTANGQRISAFIEGESARVNALKDKYAAMASEIASKSEAERSRYGLMLAIAQAQIARMQAAMEILLKNGEINITSALSAENLKLRAEETATQTLAQMAAGFTSAASVNAGISDSSSSSLSYNFSGELDVN